MGDAPLIVLKELAGNPPPQLNAIQAFFAPHVELIVTFWISIWILTAGVVMGILLQAYRHHRQKG